MILEIKITDEIGGIVFSEAVTNEETKYPAYKTVELMYDNLLYNLQTKIKEHKEGLLPNIKNLVP